jgi:hypothetical protein
MGTSTSSGGPKGGSPLDPPWLNDIPTGAGGGTPPSDDGPPLTDLPMTAPTGRYRDARRELHRYIDTGDRGALGKALGNYSGRGSGGAAAVASRMRVSAKAGAELFSMLSAVSSRSTPAISQWVDALRNSGASAEDLANAIVQKLSPPGGSADEESLRDSMAVALSKLMQDNPGLDLLNLEQEDVWALMDFFLATEVANRVCFDIGQAFERANLEPVIAVQREREMRGFIKSEVKAAVRDLRAANPNPTQSQMEILMQEAVKTTFQVFEGMV